MKPTTRYVLSSTGLVAFLLFWEGFARSGIMEPHLLPPPSTIPPALISEINEGFWQVMVWSSLRHYTIGFVLGSVLGVTLGVVVALFPKVEASQAYLARVLRPIPPLAWIPFAIIWFGITETAAAFIISIGIFWINYFTAMGAVNAVDKDLIEVARAFGHRTFPALLRKVILPGAAPGILSGLRAGLGQGWMTVVAAERPRSGPYPPALISEINEGFWQVMVWSSLRHYTIGFVLGSVLGVTLGVVVALFPKVEASQAYLARVLRPIPPLAWIPFAIIWFGITETAAAFIISIGIFWINYFTAMGAVNAVDKDLIEVARAFGHRTFPALLRKVILPGAAPGILSGLRAGLGQGWMTVVAAELFGIQGIGQRMIEAAGLLNTQVVILYMFSIAFLYGVSDYIFVRIQQRILAWQR